MKQKLITVDEHSAALIHHNMKDGLKRAEADLEVLLVARSRDLTEEERSKLPSTLVGMNRKELQEQIDPWISLRDHYKYFVEVFDSDLW